MYRTLAIRLAALLSLMALPALLNLSAVADDTKKDEEPVKTDVVYWPTPQPVVDKMLEMAKVKKDDILYDLGCGDCRIPVTAAKKFGCKTWGFDIDPARIKDSEENIKKNKVGDLVTVKKQNIFADDFDISKASVVTLYLLPELNVKLIPKLKTLKPGSRIVSHDFDMRGVKPKETFSMRATRHDGVEGEHTIYLWVAPIEVEKEKE
jgi:SAM-dependent methyltransferase